MSLRMGSFLEDRQLPGEGNKSQWPRWVVEGCVVSWAPVRTCMVLGVRWLRLRKAEGRDPGQARAHQALAGADSETQAL